jgi:hypothetical protein
MQLALFAGASAQDSQRPWLAEVLTALLQRGAELDLAPGGEPAQGAEAAAAAWRAALPRLSELVASHAGALRAAYQAGLAMGERAAADEVRALVPFALVRVLLPHCGHQEAEGLRELLRDMIAY